MQGLTGGLLVTAVRRPQTRRASKPALGCRVCPKLRLAGEETAGYIVRPVSPCFNPMSGAGVSVTVTVAGYFIGRLMERKYVTIVERL